MIQGAENVAKMHGVSRELQDEFAYRKSSTDSGKMERMEIFLRKYYP